MNHPLSCRCGALKGYVSNPAEGSRSVCYCKDCQAFAQFLGKSDDILDKLGGTEVIATIPKYVAFIQGREVLACMSLTEKGLLRWYAGCCNTAIGNTSRDFKVPHVGLVHTCLQNPAVSLESAFGPIRMRVNTKSAKGKVDSNPVGTFVAVVRFLKSQLRARLNGNYRHTLFFVSENGAPVVQPVVLTITERERLKNAV